MTKVYVTRPGGTRTLLEQHTYDVYPAGVTGASPKGMKTASRIAQIGSDGNVSGYADISWSYDERKRPVQTVVRYGDAGVLSESTEYGFSGEVTSRTFAYTRGSDTDRMTLSYAYDVRGRMTTETATLDPSSGTSSSATLTHSYDALGRLSGTTAEVQGGIQVVTEQDYTLQGWIESLEVSVNEAVLFFQSLGYDGTDVLSGTVPLHTGIVTRKDEAWTSGGGAAATRTEGYAYDHVGRLSKEVLSENIISYSYDQRGNILSVTGGTSPGTYVHDGYRLTSAQVPQTASFTHDALGRMTYDGLTGQSTAYNDLDLVRNISCNGTTLANYSYLSDGTKLEAVEGGGEGLVYRGPFVYRKSPGSSSLTLESVSFGGGRLAAGRVLLHVRDYLGSVRAVIDGSTGAAYKASDYSTFGNESSVSSVETSAVPSGMTLREAYTGKEDQTPDFGTSYTDFGARQYSPQLRRWMVPDPMSEKYYGTSPYAFCGNNPVNFVDPDGKREWPVNPQYNGFKRRHENNYRNPRPKHNGVDINIGAGSNDFGAPVYATHDGIITKYVNINDDNNAGGNRIQITSESGEVATYYMHLNTMSSFKVGDYVSEGTIIGTIGGSGKGVVNAYTPHLHYEIKIDGEYINPAIDAQRLIDPQQLISPVHMGVLLPAVVKENRKSLKINLPDARILSGQDQKLRYEIR
ncbi:MAG: peptidoglycan DD-metalloendopeptidase family protein [Bacteroidales bacterium]|nr:peptidoglycan DD-metalloendopeptidase family protein [Bacteroidales bacterium]